MTLAARCKRLKQSDLAFPTRNGKAKHGKNRLALTRVAKRAGMDDTSFWLHKFRATTATNWLAWWDRSKNGPGAPRAPFARIYAALFEADGWLTTFTRR